TERKQADHHQGTGHRHWTLIRGLSAGYATRTPFEPTTIPTHNHDPEW
ncbi:hypothetical protein LCGC14_2523370, partial [marine sediment metagenome]